MFPSHLVSENQGMRNRSLAWASVPSAGIKIQSGWGRDNVKTGSPALAINPSWRVSWGQVNAAPTVCKTTRPFSGFQKQIVLRVRKTVKMKTSVYLTCCLPLLPRNVTTERKGKEKKGFSGSSCQDVSDKTDKRWQRTELEFYIISFTLRRKKNIYGFNVFAQGLVPVWSSHLICRAALLDTAM